MNKRRTRGHAPDGAPRPGPGRPRALGFAQKLTLAMLLVLALSLSLGGAVVLTGNFSDALGEAGQQAEAQHLLQCYALESDLMDIAAQGETVTDSSLARYGSSLEDYVGDKLVALYRADETSGEADVAQPVLRMVYTSFPWQTAPTGNPDTYQMYRDADGRTYMLFETQVNTIGTPVVTLLTGHDVTSVFASRDRALLRFWEMELVVLACAGVMIALLSRWLTKPLARLTQASRNIAAGAYDERTGLAGDDEIGILSRSFDAMAGAVQEKVDALELSVRQREDFMAAFTHELKTPMTAVIGYADTLRSMQCEPRQQQSAANYIFSEARRVETLSEKLLQLLGLRDAAPALEPLALGRVFARAEASLAPSIAPVTVHFAPAPDVFVMGDADLLVDLLYNLVQNAAHAKPKTGQVDVVWRTEPDGAHVALTVRDTGCGIPAAALARVTEPFYMVDKSRARAGGGSGMGLALCERIAVLHGGQLHIESREGEGTAVTVRLAAAKGGSADA